MEDIFDSVEDSKDFDELTRMLNYIIVNELEVDRVTDTYIRYKVFDSMGNMNYLKIKVVPNKV